MLRDPVAIDTESGSVEFSYDAIVAAGGEVGGGIRVDYTGMPNKQYYIDFLHQGDAANQYTWCQFTEKLVTEEDGYSILHLTESTMNEINSFSKNLVVEGGFVNISGVKVVLPADMPEAPQPEASVTLDKTELSLEVGQDAILAATVVPASAELTWTSSDPAVAAVATVGADGLVTAVAEGEAVITADYCGSKATCTVTVEKQNSILDINADANEPVEYFNLQGVRVINPAAGGIYIRRQGNNVTKILVK